MWFFEGVPATETYKGTNEAGEVGEEVVKTGEGSETLPSLHANKLVCHGFMDAGRKLGQR